MSFAAAIDWSTPLERRVGPSTRTSFVGVMRLARETVGRGQRGTVSLICNARDRCGDTLFDAARQVTLGIADDSLRQQVLNADAFDALESATAVPMGQSTP